jgi:integrase
MPLTDAACRNAKARETAYKLFDTEGLHLHVSKAGGRVWRLKYRFGGKEQLLTFGSYGREEDGGITLTAARDMRSAAKKLLKADPPRNPATVKKLAAIQSKIAQGNTFALVAEELIQKRLREGLAEVTADKLRWYVKLMDDIGERPIGEIEAVELLQPLQQIDRSGRHETASACLELAGRVFRYGVATGRAKHNVAADLRGALTSKKAKHRAAITDAKGTGRLLRLIDAYGGSMQTRLALKFLAHCFPRPGELRLAEWPEFDLDEGVWNIPAARTKMRKPHAIPLSRQALAILAELHEVSGGKGRGLVFHSPRGAKLPMSENTLNVALRAMGVGQDEHCSHGFRSTASTLLNESGKWSADAIERALAHGPQDAVRAAYHRGQHWAERVEMAQWWSDYLDLLRDGGDVLPFKRKA